MAKVSKTKEYAIKYLADHAKKSPKEISTELKISLADVEQVLGEKPKTAKAKTDKTKDLMIRQTSAKKTNTVSIMTEAAAQLSDEFVKNIGTRPDSSSHIYRPRD